MSHSAIHSIHHHDPKSAELALALVETEQKRAKAQRQEQRATLYAAARVLFSSVFLLSGVTKALAFENTRDALERSGLAASGMMLTLAIAAELVGGLFLALGYRARLTALALVGYLAVVTLFAHHDLADALNRAFMVSNIGLVAALLMVAAHGAGRSSLDTRR